MMKKFYLLAVLFFVSRTTLLAQSVDVHFNGLGFLDNREYKDFVARSRTYSGTRTTLDFGLNLDSLNHFIVGANAIHEFGARPFFLTVDPVAYYSYQSSKWLFNAGEFPREGLLTDYPRALLNDTLRYYRPNVQGLLARYKTGGLTETGWIDWTSRQTNTDREEFLFGASGTYKPSASGPFYIKHYFLLLHDAGPAIVTADNQITDNGGAQIRLGADFSHKTAIDSLTIEVGGMSSFERTRGITGWNTPTGLVASAYIGFKHVAFWDEFYKGGGSHIFYGDAFYQRKVYNRLDIIWNTFLYKNVTGQFILSLHQTPGNLRSNQEAFRVTYDLGRKVIARFKTDD